jgi:hypothetical protein
MLRASVLYKYRHHSYIIMQNYLISLLTHNITLCASQVKNDAKTIRRRVECRLLKLKNLIVGWVEERNPTNLAGVLGYVRALHPTYSSTFGLPKALIFQISTKKLHKSISTAPI